MWNGVFDSFCGCVDLKNGTKVLGIIVAIVKLFRVVEVGFLLFVSLLLHVFMGVLPVEQEVMFALPVAGAVIMVIQFAMIILFIVKLSNNNIDGVEKICTTNAVCFGIECIGEAVFWVLLVYSGEYTPSDTETYIIIFVVDILVAVLNLYFILLVRSCVVKNYEVLPITTYTKEKDTEDVIAIPFKRL